MWIIFKALFFFSLQLGICVRKDGWKYPSNTEWWTSLKEKMTANAKISQVGLITLMHNKPVIFYFRYSYDIRKYLNKQLIC